MGTSDVVAHRCLDDLVPRHALIEVQIRPVNIGGIQRSVLAMLQLEIPRRDILAHILGQSVAVRLCIARGFFKTAAFVIERSSLAVNTLRVLLEGLRGCSIPGELFIAVGRAVAVICAIQHLHIQAIPVSLVSGVRCSVGGLIASRALRSLVKLDAVRRISPVAQIGARSEERPLATGAVAGASATTPASGSKPPESEAFIVSFDE